MIKLTPFADDAASIALDTLTIENGKEQLSLYGSLDITRDKVAHGAVCIGRPRLYTGYITYGLTTLRKIFVDERYQRQYTRRAV